MCRKLNREYVSAIHFWRKGRKTFVLREDNPKYKNRTLVLPHQTMQVYMYCAYLHKPHWQFYAEYSNKVYLDLENKINHIFNVMQI